MELSDPGQQRKRREIFCFDKARKATEEGGGGGGGGEGKGYLTGLTMGFLPYFFLEFGLSLLLLLLLRFFSGVDLDFSVLDVVECHFCE